MLANNPNSDWVKVEPQDTLDFGGPVAEPSDEETEHEEPGDEDTDPEEWTDLFMGGDATQSTPAKVSVGATSRWKALMITEHSQKDSIMGQSEDAMEYDQINFFKHLYVPSWTRLSSTDYLNAAYSTLIRPVVLAEME